MRRVSAAFVLASLVLPAYVPDAAVAGRTVVVFIGGLGSTPATTLEDFRLLHGGLFTRAGYRLDDVRYFDYASCGSLADFEAAQAAKLRGLHDGGEASGVVLVGHSNGGVIAVDVPSAAANGRASLEPASATGQHEPWPGSSCSCPSSRMGVASGQGRHRPGVPGTYRQMRRHSPVSQIS